MFFAPYPDRSESAVKYLCLGYYEERAWQAMAENDRQSLLEECRAYDETLWKSGYYLSGNALPGASGATTLRFESGKVSVTEGPFCQSREQLGGILVLEAKDLNHAIQLMSRLPCMQMGGCLEIRPIESAEPLTGEVR
jgi:hypothetical protein